MKPIIIDVREPAEYETGHVAGAINVPPRELNKIGISPTPLDDVPKDAEIIVYCHTGSRSNVAQMLLAYAGYTNVTNGINKDHVEARLNR